MTLSERVGMKNTPEESVGIALKIFRVVDTRDLCEVRAALPILREHIEYARSDCRIPSDDIASLKQMYLELEGMYPKQN